MLIKDRVHSSDSDHLKQNSQVTTFQVWFTHPLRSFPWRQSFLPQTQPHLQSTEALRVCWGTPREGCWEVSTQGKRLGTLLCLGRLLFPNASGSYSLMGPIQVGLRRGLIVLCSQGPWWLDLAVAGSRSPNNSMVSRTEIASPFGLVSGSLW